MGALVGCARRLAKPQPGEGAVLVEARGVALSRERRLGEETWRANGSGRLVAAWCLAGHGGGDLELVVADGRGGEDFAELFVQARGVAAQQRGLAGRVVRQRRVEVGFAELLGAVGGESADAQGAVVLVEPLLENHELIHQVGRHLAELFELKHDAVNEVTGGDRVELVGDLHDVGGEVLVRPQLDEQPIGTAIDREFETFDCVRDHGSAPSLVAGEESLFQEEIGRRCGAPPERHRSLESCVSGAYDRTLAS